MIEALRVVLHLHAGRGVSPSVIKHLNGLASGCRSLWAQVSALEVRSEPWPCTLLCPQMHRGRRRERPLHLGWASHTQQQRCFVLKGQLSEQSATTVVVCCSLLVCSPLGASVVAADLRVDASHSPL